MILARCLHQKCIRLLKITLGFSAFFCFLFSSFFHSTLQQNDSGVGTNVKLMGLQLLKDREKQKKNIKDSSLGVGGVGSFSLKSH